MAKWYDGLLAQYRDHPEAFKYVSGGFVQFYQDHVEGRTLEDNEFSEWLYGDYDEKKLATFEKLYSIKPLQIYMDYLLDRRSDSEYMSRFGLTYSDIHDPRKLKQTSSASRLYGYSMNFVSDNVKRLYK